MPLLERIAYEPQTDSKDFDIEDKGEQSRRPDKYMCWFIPELWDKIESALKLNGYKFRQVVHYLQYV